MTLLSIMFFALALQPAEPPPSVEVARDIVVIGNKLKDWRARVYEKRGKMLCDTRASSGDKAIDAIGCTAMATCLTELRPRLIASADRKRPATERKALNAAVAKDLGTCTTGRRDTLIADLAERRFQARQGTNNASN